MVTEIVKLMEAYADERGRVLVGESMTYVAEPLLVKDDRSKTTASSEWNAICVWEEP